MALESLAHVETDLSLGCVTVQKTPDRIPSSLGESRGYDGGDQGTWYSWLSSALARVPVTDFLHNT